MKERMKAKMNANTQPFESKKSTPQLSNIANLPTT